MYILFDVSISIPYGCVMASLKYKLDGPSTVGKLVTTIELDVEYVATMTVAGGIPSPVTVIPILIFKIEVDEIIVFEVVV
jgi:hypothetical protein